MLALCLALALPSPAHADSTEPTSADAEQAAELKRKGDAAMETLQYADALAHYDAAWSLVEDPALLYNRARAHQMLGNFPQALELFEAFSIRAPAELRERVKVLDSLMAEVRARVSTLELSCNVRGARVLVRDKRLGTTPLAGPLKLNAGRALVEVEAEGYFPWKRELDLRGGGSTRLEAKLASRRTTGVLIVTSPTAGARVTVDGRAAGNVPVDVVLGPGMHRIVVRRDGYEVAETSALVGTGEKKTISVPLEKTRPVTAKWWFWTGVGATVVGGTVLTVALLTEKSAPNGSIDPGQVSAPLLRWR